ncbi:UbiA prenyltransferase family [Daedaleopsis nitida]|nr:UbiA prenyltransferase family [Daedaleopsis nitida]
MPLIAKLATLLASFLVTCFLFTKSDIKTTVIPVSALAAASAPMHSATRLLHVVFWVWFHVLQFDVSNQCMDPDEDAQNKSDRPLPAKRISIENAIRIRWLLVPACFALSLLYSVETFYASLALIILTLIYNEFGAHKGHWVIRNLVNALGFASFEAGATLVAGTSPNHLDGVALCSIAASAGIFATTIQAQDFKDVDGDRAIGRRTIPIVFRTQAKWTVIVPLVLWSVGLSALWSVDFASCFALVVLAMFVGLQYMSGKGRKEYQVAFYWYNAWLSAAHLLPAYYRMHG